MASAPASHRAAPARPEDIETPADLPIHAERRGNERFRAWTRSDSGSCTPGDGCLIVPNSSGVSLSRMYGFWTSAAGRTIVAYEPFRPAATFVLRQREPGLIVKVVRSGGFAGLVARGELDTSAEPDSERLEQAVRGLDPARLGSGRPQPDRYVYRLEVRDTAEAEPTELTVAEQDLDHDVAWLLDRVLHHE